MFLHFGINFLALSSLNYGVVFPEIIVTVFAVSLGYWAYQQFEEKYMCKCNLCV
jgi:hypothetical protein